jgi:hypothetical protein
MEASSGSHKLCYHKRKIGILLLLLLVTDYILLLVMIFTTITKPFFVWCSVQPRTIKSLLLKLKFLLKHDKVREGVGLTKLQVTQS